MNWTSKDQSYTYLDILPVFLSNFRKDFDCLDVESQLRNILAKKDVDFIIKSDPSIQSYHLFWKLYTQSEETVKLFVEEILKSDSVNGINYGFLMTALKTELQEPRQSTKVYISELDRLRNDNQRFAQYNVSRAKPYVQLHSALMKLRPSKNVLLMGALGSGKQWLSLDVCSSYAVQSQMGFKIFWLEMKDCCTQEKILKLLQSLLHQIDPTLHCDSEHSINLRMESVRTELRWLLKNKPYENCLLVLCNVRNKMAWDMFNLGCKILVTTRNKGLSKYLSLATTTHINLPDVLTPEEVESLLCKYLCCDPHELSKDMLKNCMQSSNPRKLSFIAESMRDGLTSWDHWRHICKDKLSTIIESSLNVLDPNHKVLFQKLFIFFESANIPIDLVNLVWSIDQITYQDPMPILKKLHKYSFIEMQPQMKTIKISPIYYELRHLVNEEASLHHDIINSYNIIQVFEQSSLTFSNLDNYFYNYIGHHIINIPDLNLSRELLRTVFLDFRFLEEKIRQDITAWNAAGSILNTLQQLRSYEESIADNDMHYKTLVNNLLDFLPKAEEKIISSKHTSLLQVALMSNQQPVQKEALSQVQRFRDNVWFTERGHFHQNRQIINLGQYGVRHAVYLNDDVCVIALDNNQILLADVSLESEHTTIFEDADCSQISELRIFDNQRHMVTLHNNGSIKLWGLWDVCKSRPHTKTNSNSIIDFPKENCIRSYKQLINRSIRRLTRSNIDRKITSFYIEETKSPNPSIQLHMAFVNGDICICDWDSEEQKFKQSYTPMLATDQRDLHSFVKVLDRFYVMTAKNSTLTVWDLRSSSKCLENIANHNFGIDPPVAMEVFVERLDNGVVYTTILQICSRSVRRIRLEHSLYHNITLKPEILYMRELSMGSITCAKRSQDARCLILGTEKGVVVFDLKLSDAVLYCQFSEHISCVDIFELNDNIFKYIVICGAQGKHVLNIHTLKETIKTTESIIIWGHTTDEQLMNEQETYTSQCLEPTVYLLPLMDMSEDRKHIFVVDSKHRIHKILPRKASPDSDHHGLWTMIKQIFHEKQERITALSAYNDSRICVGYSDGSIIDVHLNIELSQKFISEGIDYLAFVNAQTLIASAHSSQKTLIFQLRNGQHSGNWSSSELTLQNPLQLQMATMGAHLFEDNFILLFSEDGVTYISLKKRDQVHCLVQTEKSLVGYDLQNSLLFLGIRDKKILIYQLESTLSALSWKFICSEDVIQMSEISCLAATNDGSLMALGFDNGSIALYRYHQTKITLIYIITPAVHTQHINQLKFSPCRRVLASCAEQICFWSVVYMLNNQLEQNILRQSSRRYNSKSVNDEEVDAMPIVSCTSQEGRISFGCVTEKEKRPYHIKKVLPIDSIQWINKRGNVMRPELLNCVKLTGNPRNFFTNIDFTQFYIIDDEGMYFEIELVQFSSEKKVETDMIWHPTIPDRQYVAAPLNEDDNENGIDVVGNSDKNIQALERSPNILRPVSQKSVNFVRTLQRTCLLIILYSLITVFISWIYP